MGKKAGIIGSGSVGVTFANGLVKHGFEVMIGTGDASKREEVFSYFREQFRTRPRDEWFEYLKQSDICVAPVYSLEEAAADPHNRARQMVVEVEHPRLGSVRQVGIGPKLSETPGRVRTTAPRAGQHTDEVLVSLGYTREQIEGLRTSGTVG